MFVQLLVLLFFFFKHDFCDLKWGLGRDALFKSVDTNTKKRMVPRILKRKEKEKRKKREGRSTISIEKYMERILLSFKVLGTGSKFSCVLFGGFFVGFSTFVFDGYQFF